MLLEILEQFPKEFPIIETCICAIIAFGLGLFWYHPKVMGDKRVEAHVGDGTTKVTIMAYIVGLLLWFITASVYSFLTTFLSPETLPNLLGLSTFIWVGFILPSSMISGFYSGNKLMVTAVDSSYYLAGLYLFAVIHEIL